MRVGTEALASSGNEMRGKRRLGRHVVLALGIRVSGVSGSTIGRLFWSSWESVRALSLSIDGLHRWTTYSSFSHPHLFVWSERNGLYHPSSCITPTSRALSMASDHSFTISLSRCACAIWTRD